MRTAIIGSGNIVNTHAQELTGMGKRIALVVGIIPEQTEEFQRKWDVEEASTDFQRALDPNITTVHVCTPPTLHYQMVKDLILAGKHVICEKPLCLTAAEAKELYELTLSRKIVTAVNFNVRYHEACNAFRKKVSSEDFGRLCLVHGTYEQEFHALPADYMWRYQKTLAGPMRATTEIGSHWIDLVRFLTGEEIVSVSATYGKFTPDRYVKDGMMYETLQESSEKIRVDSDDAVIAALRFGSGAIGNLFLSEVTHGRSNYVSMEITGTRQTIRWDSEDPYKLYTAEKFGGTLQETNAFAGGFPNTFSAFFREVYRDMDAGTPSAAPTYPTFQDGYRNAAVCEAIYSSANHHSIWTEVK